MFLLQIKLFLTAKHPLGFIVISESLKMSLSLLSAWFYSLRWAILIIKTEGGDFFLVLSSNVDDYEILTKIWIVFLNTHLFLTATEKFPFWKIF